MLPSPSPDGPRQQFDGYRASAIILLQEFGKADSQIYQKEFKGMLDKVGRMRTDILITPFAKSSLMSDIEQLVEVLSVARHALAPMREYQKSQRATHLEKLLSHLNFVIPFMEKQSISVVYELKAIWWKARCADALKNLGLEEALAILAQVSAQDGEKVPAWSRPSEVIIDCVTTSLFDFLRQPITDQQKGDQWTKTKQDFLRQVTMYLAFSVEREALLGEGPVGAHRGLHFQAPGHNKTASQLFFEMRPRWEASRSPLLCMSHLVWHTLCVCVFARLASRNCLVVMLPCLAKLGLVSACLCIVSVCVWGPSPHSPMPRRR